MGVRDTPMENRFTKILNTLERGLRVVCSISLGYLTEEGRSSRMELTEIVFYERLDEFSFHKFQLPDATNSLNPFL